MKRGGGAISFPRGVGFLGISLRTPPSGTREQSTKTRRISTYPGVLSRARVRPIHRRGKEAHFPVRVFPQVTVGMKEAGDIVWRFPTPPSMPARGEQLRVCQASSIPPGTTIVRSMLARALLFWRPPERVQEFIDAQQKRKVGSKNKSSSTIFCVVSEAQDFVVSEIKSLSLGGWSCSVFCAQFSCWL